MKLNVGDYVRTEKGNISKIKWISQEIMSLSETKSATIHLENGETICMYYGDTINASSNIIDLIEVGDYVNGCLVCEIKDEWFILNYADIETYEQLKREKENIKSIVTKEQFEQMEYKIN